MDTVPPSNYLGIRSDERAERIEHAEAQRCPTE